MTNIRNAIKAFKLGVEDGFAEPYDIGIGMTYDSSVRQWLWDWGANIGQLLGRIA